MGEYADDIINRMIDGGSYFSGPRSRSDRRRKQIPKCLFCGAYPLRIEEFEENVWHLAEYDENNVLTRHVCKMRKFGARLSD